MPNLFEPAWDEGKDQGPFRSRPARLGAQAGAQQLGATLYEIPPGAASFPFHAHHHNEEMAIVISGRPTLRTPEGERELAVGEVVAFPAGGAGAHRFDNRTEEPARILLISTMLSPEIVEYPDSGKVGVRSPHDLRKMLAAEPELGYWDGEV